MLRRRLVMSVSFCCCCFGWTWPPSSLNDRVSGEGDQARTAVMPIETGLTQDEINHLFLSTNALQLYAGKSDCFQRSANFIQTRCGESHMDEDTRIQAAIAMTLCEISTASRHFIPLECAAFTNDLSSSWTRANTRGDCVEALSRSAQYWSSYSGYLRDIPQLCYAFRRWHDIDTARDIYRNATQEKLALIQLVINREKTYQDHFRMWEQTSDDVHHALMSLRGLSDNIQSSADTVVAQLGDDVHLMFGAIFSSTLDFLDHHRNMHSHSMTEFDKTLGTIALKHEDLLLSFIPAVQQSFLSRMDDVFELIMQHSQGTLQLTDEVQRQWVNFSQDVSIMKDSVEELTRTMSRASLLLDASTHQALLNQQIQQETSSSAVRLTETIDQLIVTTQIGLQEINRTADAVEQKMRHGRRSDWFRFDSFLFYFFNRHLSIRLVLGSTSILWYLFRFGASLSRIIFSIALKAVRLVAPLDNEKITRAALSSHVTLPPLEDGSQLDLSNPSSWQYHRAQSFQRDPRLLRLSSRPRVSRIPDRLCVASADHALWK